MNVNCVPSLKYCMNHADLLMRVGYCSCVDCLFVLRSFCVSCWVPLMTITSFIFNDESYSILYILELFFVFVVDESFTEH